jgi:hypothetical protein
MKRSKNGGDSGTGVYMREGTISRVMAVDRPYGEFYGFYSVSPEYFGYTLVQLQAVLVCSATRRRIFYMQIHC